ncbi:MAG: XdhC family protein [Chloroflexi bacterium]|nr:XdhC family protein [Chloroflexota bacterium]
MRDILADLERWNLEREPIALATVIQTWGSSPRQPGAKMGMASNHRITGSVSGGCVEGAVYETGMEVLESKKAQLLHFGVADETAWEVGLACGGSIDVFVKPLDAAFFSAVSASLKDEQPFAVATVVKGPMSLLGNEIMVRDDGSSVGQIGKPFAQPAIEAARAALASGQTQRQSITAADQSIEVFVESVWPSPTLVIVGGVHIAIALASLAKTLGYKTILIDPRAAFGNEARFPHVDQLIRGWPDEAFSQIAITHSTAVAMLTHDPKLDDPALLTALPSKAFYVGALGSQKTQEKRRARLREAGLTEAQISRIYGPIGLPLGARTPEEIALSVMAEIVAARNGVRLH